MAMKEYAAFPKAPELLELHHQIVYNYIKDTLFSPLHRNAIDEF